MAFAELASSGATLAWRASWASELKRSIGPISQSSFAAVSAAQPGSFTSRGASGCRSRLRGRGRARRIVRVSVRQRPTQVAGDPYLGRLLARGRAAGRAGRARPPGRAHPAAPARAGSSSCRCQRSRCWARRRSATRSVTVVDEQLQLPQTSPRRHEARPAAAPATRPGRQRARRSGPTCRASRPRPPLRRRQPAAAPAPAARPQRASARSSPRVTCRQSSNAHSRSPAKRPRPDKQHRSSTAQVSLRQPHGRPRRRRPPSASACVRPPRSRSLTSPPTVAGATGERTDLNRGKLPGSYQVTLDGLGKAAATQRWQVSPPGATFGNRVSRRQPESLRHDQTPPPDQTDIEFGNVTSKRSLPCAA